MGKEEADDNEDFYSCFLKWRALTPMDGAIVDKTLRRFYRSIGGSGRIPRRSGRQEAKPDDAL